MHELSEAAERVRVAAQEVYEQRLRAQLEPSHVGEIIAIEPDSGEFVLGRTFREVEIARRARFGTKMTYTFRVGGGGAVSIGRGTPSGRLPGRV